MKEEEGVREVYFSVTLEISDSLQLHRLLPHSQLPVPYCPQHAQVSIAAPGVAAVAGLTITADSLVLFTDSFVLVKSNLVRTYSKAREQEPV